MTPRPIATHTVRGIVCMMASGVLVSVNDAVIKWLTADYPTGQIVTIRGLFILVSALLFAWRYGGVSALRVRDWRGQILRGLLSATSAFLFVTSVSVLPLADTVALTFAGPLFVTALATPMLGEQVGWRRWAAVVVGFAGVVLMVGPTGDAVRWVALMPLGAALSGAFRDLITRRITATESSTATLCVTTLVIVASGLMALPFGWQPPRAEDVGLLALCGLLLGGSQYLMIEALRWAEATVVVPFKYSQLLWALMFGFLIWSQVPNASVAAGATLVIGSGLYIWNRESRLAKT